MHTITSASPYFLSKVTVTKHAHLTVVTVIWQKQVLRLQVHILIAKKYSSSDKL